MSRYLSRIYETLTPSIHATTGSFKEEKYNKEELFDGFTVRVWGSDDEHTPYMIWNASLGAFERKDKPESKWVMARWYNPSNDNRSFLSPTMYLGDSVDPEQLPDYIPLFGTKGEPVHEEFMYTTGGGVVRDEFVSSGGEYDDYFGMRGMPADMSEGARQIFTADCSMYDITYVTLSELRSTAELFLEKYKKGVESDILDGKLGEILSLLTKEGEKKSKKKRKSDEDDLYFDDYTDIDRYEALINEVHKATAFCDYMYAYEEEDKRIIFFIS